MMTFCLVLAAGSCQTSLRGGPLFCDVEEARRFGSDEVKWRAANARRNLELDLATNETGETYCGWKGGE